MERGLRDDRLRDRLMQTFMGRERPARRRLLRRAAEPPAQAAAHARRGRRRPRREVA